MRSVHGDGAYEVMLFELIENGAVVYADVECNASTLALTSPNGGSVRICLPSESTVRVKLHDATLRITARLFRNHAAIPENDGNWIFQLASASRSYRLIPLRGDLSVDAPWGVKQCDRIIAEMSSDETGQAEIAIEELTWMKAAQKHEIPFDTLADRVQREYEAFAQPYLQDATAQRQTLQKAAYLNWSSVVHPHGLIQRPAMFMSKNWMTNVWSWDHAFNALATCISDQELAWDQFMVTFDHQNASGQIPDFINDTRFLTNFVKPPIHGWIFSRMLEFCPSISYDQMQEAYEKLSKWTDWWRQFRTPDADGLPVYWHGNDSGWDNGTVFDVGFPIKSPDLAAFLILQMDTLSYIATCLRRQSEAEEWQRQASELLDALMTKLWTGECFQAIHSVSGEPSAASDSVFRCLPIILGYRLPEEICDILERQISRHITDWGPATEHVDSACYEPNGYWRGPIWAPPTMILVDGLVRAGKNEMAVDIGKRFCALCVKSGFAENFNAITGEPLCDPAYTWTSSVFLILSTKYIQS